MSEWETAVTWWACNHEERRMAYKPIPGSAHYHVSLQTRVDDGWRKEWVTESTSKPTVGGEA